MNCNQVVPCGRCPECITRRIQHWSFRLLQEEKHAYHSQFITLTYDTKFIPITNAGYFTLVKKDCQDFFKRLRFYVSELEKIAVDKTPFENPIKYYLVGEYGDKFKRPHYHIILYNCPQTHAIEMAWNKGNIDYGRAEAASVVYTLSYISKPTKIPEHINDDRLPEFSLMSKGLGAKYLTPEMIAWHKADLTNRMYVTQPGNKKLGMPRYYKDKIYPKNSLGQSPERNLIAEHQRKLADEKLSANLQANPNYYRDQAELHKQQFNQLAKKAAKRQKL